jgi:type II secretory pathway pseudopilin PulG
MNQRGSTLLEALVAIAIVGIAIAGIAPAFFVQMDANGRNEQRTEAAAAAARVMETLRREDPASLPTSGSSDPEQLLVGNRMYDVVVHYCAVPSYCGAGSRHVRTEVSLHGRLLYAVESVYTQLR